MPRGGGERSDPHQWSANRCRRDSVGGHAKSFVVDGAWSSVGTVNFDNRSQALNNESTLLVLDRLFGATMDSVFREDLRFSREVLLPSFRRRAWSKRVMERAARLLGPVL